MRQVLKKIAPKSFNDGLYKCNELGKKLIIKKDIDKFLDVGCGGGAISIEFAEIAKPNELKGVEFNDVYRSQAEDRGISCVSFDLNGNWDFDDNYFDLILSSQNIEHLHNTRRYLEECYRCLDRGGN